jgi:transcription-repair coupling factor (superfamily II helicase)
VVQVKVVESKFENIHSAIEHLKVLCIKECVFLCLHSESSLKAIDNILKEHFCSVNIVTHANEAKKGMINVCKYFTNRSFVINEKYFFTEEHIFGRVIVSAKKKRDISAKRQMMLANSYSIGDLVVHKKHGIARFEGLSMVKDQNREYDTVKLVYKGNDVLYIPVVNVQFLTKYGAISDGIEVENLLDRLHTNGFQVRKDKIQKNLFEIAERLVSEAAKRKNIESTMFEESDITRKFESNFLFALTDDQALAIEECKKDLQDGIPMDRLICGDVGFGKTEVAMRSIALVTLGKGLGQTYGQCCIICPTTLLAQQHYKTFQERFNGFGVKIAKITRTVTAKERSRTIEQLKVGEIDILIATHAGFNTEITFQNLELLIIDEEQHFGVEQKEKMKERHPCHMLLLSATPIPRTLQMGLSGLKDISIIATPPFDRLLPQTQVMVFDSMIIANAIIREKQRGGRTFFVCPRVSDLEEQKARVIAITGGEISVGVAHGGMPPAELEVVMDKFYMGVYDVLVTTSIIESGIDISFANTMILYRAEMFGLSALYQLRGRVGRGKVQSYVYFVVKDINRMTDNAKQRLKAISSINSLGEGMKIAISDLDIRGAGNVVGKEQHGKMDGVGVELYEHMLQQAVVDVKTEKHEVTEDFIPEIKIAIPFFIPEEYIPDFALRMQVYREISNLSLIDDIAILKEDMEDRFGKIPQPIFNLIEIVKVKIKAKQLNIVKFEVGVKGVVLQFAEYFKKSDKMIEQLQKNPHKIKVKSESSVLFMKDGDDLLRKAFDVMVWVEKL